jgi:Mg-chelatase subunit ChlD
MNAKRLAQLQPGGGTPLADVYARLMPYVRRNKGKLYFITLTDGEPSNAFYCKQLIQTLKRHCKMFAVAFEDSMVGAVRLAFNLQTLGYERYVALDDVKKLPEKVLGLLGE